METELVFKIIFGVLGGLGIFLLGMKNMSDGMQAVAGERLRKLINAVTNNRIIACIVGTGVTCIIQSSSITTVMVVGMVNAGLMSLKQAIGVVMGANIGTTITAWILVINIGKYGLPILGISAIIYLFTKKDRLRFVAGAVMGLGMVFFGLELMKNGFSPLKDLPEVIEWFSRFKADSYFGVIKCCLVGAVITGIVQSSSATVGITMGLAITGIIDYKQAGALVLGENIGTTVTALLASLGAGTNAKRAAYAHFMFNVLGVLWITAIFPFYINLVAKFVGADPGAPVYAETSISYPYALKAIAATHSIFNIVNVLLFLPFVGLLARFLTALVPDKVRKEIPHLAVLDVRMLETPSIAIEQSRKEILKMAEGAEKMMRMLRDIILTDKTDEKVQEKIFNRERVLDVVQKEISEYLEQMITGNLSHEIAEECRQQLRMADEYESVSDYIVNILKLNLKVRAAEQHFTPEAKKEILELHDLVSEYLTFVNLAVAEQNRDILNKAETRGKTITHNMKEFRSNHLERMSNGQTTALRSLAFLDILNAYRRIKDHALNIAEAIVGEK